MRSAVEKCLAITRRALGARLEAGAGPASWPRLPTPVRRTLRLPEATVIGVGGALLGGSGRTPLALAIVEWLATRQAPVAFVGHGYGASVRRPLRVRAWHDARAVGDEAIMAYRRLAPRGIPVWVGPREETLTAAASSAAMLVVDGLLQSEPRPLALSVLALSGPAPWGSGQLLPRGDLRAAPRRLVAAADHVVVLADAPVRIDEAPHAEHAPLVLRVPSAVSDAARWGLLLGIARPERVVMALAARGHRFATFLRAADHGAAAWEAEALRRMQRNQLEGFLVTAKCDAALASSRLPRAVLELELGLPRRLRDALERLMPKTHTSHLVAPCLAERSGPRVSP